MFPDYSIPVSTRYEDAGHSDGFRGGKLVAVGQQAFRENESGILDQNVIVELEPIAGRLVTEITLHVASVYVPVPAMAKMLDPENPDAGNLEILRRRFQNGEVIFGLEAENELSQRMGINPRSVNGDKLVSQTARLAHNCAVNHLRVRKYVNARQVPANNVSVTPALLGSTILDRLGAVLDPEDRINGRVNFSIPEKIVHIRGVGRHIDGTPAPSSTNVEVIERRPDGSQNVVTYGHAENLDASASDVFMRTSSGGVPDLQAVVGGEGHGISLADFYIAEKVDELTRGMRHIVGGNPEYGEEQVARLAHGMSVDVGREPFVVYETERPFHTSIHRAMDGPNLDEHQTNTVANVEFTVPLPATPFGGVVVTFVAVKPFETIKDQPHPIMSDEWKAVNYVADELAFDPVAVSKRDIWADVPRDQEADIVCYTGNHGLLRHYSTYGFTRRFEQEDGDTVDFKSARWQMDVPLSVTPDSVIYPDDIDHYPWADQLGDVARYTYSKRCRISTPRRFGPSPVEELAEIATSDIFEPVENNDGRINQAIVDALT